MFDYQGRPWWQAPSGVRADGGDHACYVPKKCVKKLTGHTKGVQCVEYYPGTGHLLLSASLDGKCKIWDIMGDRNVRRTYHGHTEGVRSIHFNNTGSEFLSSGFDRLIRMWDVETGQAKGITPCMNYCNLNTTIYLPSFLLLFITHPNLSNRTYPLTHRHLLQS